MKRNADRRSHERIAVSSRAYIIDSDSSITGCSLIDLSFSGARLKVPYGSNIEGELTLCVPSKGIERPFEIVWRSSDQIGVTFSMNLLGSDEVPVARLIEPAKPMTVDQLRQMALSAVSAEPVNPPKKLRRPSVTPAISHWPKVLHTLSAKIKKATGNAARIGEGEARGVASATDGECPDGAEVPAAHRPTDDANQLLLSRQHRNMALYAIAAAVLIAAIPAVSFLWPGPSASAPADHRADTASAGEASFDNAGPAAIAEPMASIAAASDADQVSASADARPQADNESSAATASATPAQDSPAPRGDDLIQPWPSAQQLPASDNETLGAPKDTTALWFQSARVAPCANYGQFTAPQAFQEMTTEPCEAIGKQPAAADTTP